MLRKFLFLSFFISISISLFGQDPVFSQFFAAPLQLNPGFAGVTSAPRITLNYRNQYPNLPNAYTTYAVSYEQPIPGLNSGIGLSVMSDVAGDGLYKTTRISGIFGYKVRIKRDYVIQFGVEAGIIQSRLDWDRLIFEDNINPDGTEDPRVNPYTSEELRPKSLNNIIPDISAGILFYTPLFYAGVSIKHLNSPDESFFQVNNNLRAGLPLRFSVHGGWQITLKPGNNKKPSTFISPNLMFTQQGDFGQINGGVYAGLGSFFGGLWYRHTFSQPDATIILVGLKKGVMRIGYSFDFTISKLANAPGGTGGTHEISLSFNLEDSDVFKRKKHASRYNNCFDFLK